jgi:hypothetical protein
MEAVILPNLFIGTQQEEITAFYDLEHPSNDPNNWEQKEMVFGKKLIVMLQR